MSDAAAIAATRDAARGFGSPTAPAFSRRIGRFQSVSPAPLYLQLQRLLRDAIETRVLSGDDAIPTERELAIEYDVSRVTVQNAIAGLVREGLLRRRRGAGTFVVGRVETSLSTISSFSEEVAARGRIPSNRWLVRASGDATPEEASALGLSCGDRVYRFHRLRLADDVPMALEKSTIVAFALPSLDAVGLSIYAALGAVGMRPVRALQRLQSMPFAGAQADMLGVREGHAGLMIERRGFLRDGRAIEFTQSFYRSDTFDFVAELSDG